LLFENTAQGGFILGAVLCRNGVIALRTAAVLGIEKAQSPT